MNTKQNKNNYFSFEMEILVIFFFLLTLSIHGSSQITYPYRACSKATFSPNSSYLSNLNLLSSTLSSNSSHRLYFNTSIGRQPDPLLYGHFQCRGDVNSSVCQDCVTAATSNKSQNYCPLSKGAVIWFDECLLQYSSKSFFSIVTEEPSLILINPVDIGADVDGFDKLVVSTLNVVATAAAGAGAHNGSLKETVLGFATGEAGFKNETIHALAQCTGDLSREDCGECLRDAVENFPKCCSGKKGGRVLFPSCTLRYELYMFYNKVTLTTSSPESAPSPVPVPVVPVPSSLGPVPSTAAVAQLSGRSRTRMVIAITIFVAGFLLS